MSDTQLRELVRSIVREEMQRERQHAEELRQAGFASDLDRWSATMRASLPATDRQSESK